MFYERIKSSLRRRFNLPIQVRNFILTGIPRSGTSLMSTILCHSENSYCFNEIHYNVNTLPKFFEEMRGNIRKAQPIQNKTCGDGRLTTDTQTEGPRVFIEELLVHKDTENIKLGSNVNIPYLDQIDRILKNDFPVIAMVRDPVYTIASWNISSAIPEAHVEDHDMHPRWHGFDFSTEDDYLSRQAMIWEYYAQKISNIQKIKIVKYEDLVSNYSKTILEISDFLGIAVPIFKYPLINGNESKKYIDVDDIERAVGVYCSSRKTIGY